MHSERYWQIRERLEGWPTYMKEAANKNFLTGAHTKKLRV